MRLRWIVSAALLVALPTGGVVAIGKEAAFGKVDRTVETLADALPALPRSRLPDAVPEGRDVLVREFTWTYHGIPYAWRVGFERDAYEEAGARPRSLDPRAYGGYVTNPARDPALARVSQGLDALADAKGWDALERANLALAFVQGLRYETDTDSRGADDYPQLAVETLVEGRGDCEDTSILYAGLTRAIGLEVSLLLLPGHMAVGVKAPIGARGPTPDGYSYAETTRLGYRLGEIPWSFRDATITPLDVRPLPALDVAISPSPSRTGWVVRVDVWNNGTAPAGPVNLYAGVEPDPAWRGAFATTPSLPSGGHATRWMWVAAPGPNVERLRAVAWTNEENAVGAEAAAPPIKR